jgi:glycine/D-amino acid oxidase-like deaminating enzyme
MPSVADAASRTLEALVHPPGWQNPRPQRSYDVVVIGAGTAGLVSAVGAANLGARVAIVERQRVPSDPAHTARATRVRSVLPDHAMVIAHDGPLATIVIPVLNDAAALAEALAALQPRRVSPATQARG